MTNDLVSDLLSLKPLLEAHHCRTDAIDRAIASIRKDDELRDALTRPIIGIENRTAGEVFDIMCDRIRGKLSSVAGGGG
jgi:hypothetical protein